MTLKQTRKKTKRVKRKRSAMEDDKLGICQECGERVEYRQVFDPDPPPLDSVACREAFKGLLAVQHIPSEWAAQFNQLEAGKTCRGSNLEIICAKSILNGDSAYYTNHRAREIARDTRSNTFIISFMRELAVRGRLRNWMVKNEWETGELFRLGIVMVETATFTDEEKPALKRALLQVERTFTNDRRCEAIRRYLHNQLNYVLTRRVDARTGLEELRERVRKVK